jgi:hypothetical protein
LRVQPTAFELIFLRRQALNSDPPPPPANRGVSGCVGPCTRRLALLALSLAGSLLAPISPAAAEECPNESIRAEQGPAVLSLPNCMALEMVSPPRKGGQPARFPNVSAEGERVRFRSLAALGDSSGPLNGAVGDTYVATRSASGWTTSATIPAGILKGWDLFADAKSFTPDFSEWLQIGATEQQLEQGIAQALAGSVSGLFSPLSPLLVPVDLSKLGDSRRVPNVVEGSAFLGASADHSNLYFTPGPLSSSVRMAYLPGDPEPTGAGSDPNVYVAHLAPGGQPALELLGRDRLGKVWGGSCGTRLGGIGPSEGAAANGLRNQGAVSPDGARVYFSARAAQPASGSGSAASRLRILERRESEHGPWIGPLFASECHRADCSAADGDDLYQGASLDGSRVYFTTNRQLADSDLDSGSKCSTTAGEPGCDLYLYDSSLPVGERLIQVSAGEANGEHEVGKEAQVLNGVTAISGDGSHVYLVAEGVLTTATNPAGAHALPGQPNLYLYQRDESHPAGSFALLGTLAAGDEGWLWGGEGGTLRNRAYPVPALGLDSEGEQVGGDGHILLFESTASLSAADADGGHLDVFRYDGGADPPTLVCVSCRPGAPDGEPLDVAPRRVQGSPGTDFAEEGRWVSEDGETVALTTPEALLAGDGNEAPDSYLWHDGQFSRLPGGAYTTFLATNDGPFLSHDGSEVAFQTTSPLLPQDGDGSPDVYVARMGGGFPNPLESRPCDPLVEGSCQGPGAPPPAGQSAGSAIFSGPGNAKPPKSCRRPRIRRHGRCVRRHHRREKHRGSGHSRHADIGRRAAR